MKHLQKFALKKAVFTCMHTNQFLHIILRSEGFIVAGVTAKQGTYPFIAALGVINPKNPKEIIYVCGGSLVSCKLGQKNL